MKNLFFLFLYLFFALTTDAFSATRIWDGGGSDSNWNTAANWVGDAAPQSDDDLVFPSTAAKFTAHNNIFFSSSVRSIRIEGGNYTFTGQSFGVSDGITVESGTHFMNVSVILAGSQTFSAVQSGASITYQQILYLGADTSVLTIDGGGQQSFGEFVDFTGTLSLLKQGSGTTIITAPTDSLRATTVADGRLIFDGYNPNNAITISGGTLSGTGRVGSVNNVSGIISAGNLAVPTGIFNISGGIIFSRDSIYAVKIGGLAAGSEYDRINVSGQVSLGDAQLTPVLLNSFRPAHGDTFTILTNDGTEPVSGTFLNLPEGAVFPAALNTAFRITYQGGDGNDIAVTRVNRASFDFDGDAESDISVFKAAEGLWQRILSATGTQDETPFGLENDQIAPADFDGDLKTDIAVFRPENGVWYVLQSSDSTVSFTQFGAAGDMPVPNDFDGDGRADFAVFRPSDGTWYQLRSSNGQFFAARFGQAGDVPQMGDFDGDGRGDLAVYRAGNWYFMLSATGSFSAASFGTATDEPVPADFDGDGVTDLAVYRAGTWYKQLSSAGFEAVSFGIQTDVPVPADYDGDGRADEAVYRNGVWYLLGSAEGFSFEILGTGRDLPVPGAY